MRRAVLLPMLLALACSTSTTSEALPPSDPTSSPPVTAEPAALESVDARPDTQSGAAAERDAELGAKVAGYIDAFTNSEPCFTQDGRRVLFVSNRDGLPQLYVADAKDPTAPARRLVTSAERVSTTTPTHDGKAILYRSDTGADENWSIYRVGLDGAGTVELTPGDKLQREPPLLVDGVPGSSESSPTMASGYRRRGRCRARRTTSSPSRSRPARPRRCAPSRGPR